MKINIKNKPKIAAALNELQAQCKVRLMDTIDVDNFVNNVEKRLKELRVKKKDTVGAQLMLINGKGSFSSNYWGHPMSTWITIERFKSGWFLIAAFRSYANCDKRIDFLNVDKYQPLFRF